MANTHKQTLLANIFGTLGYFSCLVLWLWVAILYLPIILDNKQVMELLMPASETTAPPPPPVSLPPIFTIVALVVTVIIMIITVVVLLRLPVTIARTGKTVTTKAAVSLEPLIVHGRTLPPQKKRQLTVSLIKLIKLLLVLVPETAALLSILMPLALPSSIVLLVSSVLSLFSIFWFSVQYIIADVMDVKPEKLV